jgi:Tol biopolymer transport system component
LPSLLPGGKVVLYTSPAKNESLGKEARIFAQSLETGERVQVAEGWDGRYLPNGYVLFAQEGTVRAVPFDPKSMRPTGPDIPILENVTHSLFTVNPTLRTGAMQLGFSNTGVLAYAEGSVFPEIKGNVVWVDREGKETPLGVEPRNYFTIRISRDGSKVLLTTVYPPQDVWIYDLTRGTYRRQTFEGNNIYAIWGPGEEDFSFSSDAGGSRDLFRKQVDSGPTRLEILDPGAHDYHRPSAWSADGRMLALVEASQETSFDIILLEGSGKAVNILESRFSEQYPDFSPDGRWMVYSSNESGEYEIYVRAVDHGERATQISTGGGIEPAWSRDGTEIYYRMGRDFFAVPVRLRGDDVHPDRPVKLFDGDYGSSWAVRSYDVAPDGRFLLIKRPDEAALEEAIGQFFPSRIKVIVNWFAEINFGTQ